MSIEITKIIDTTDAVDGLSVVPVDKPVDIKPFDVKKLRPLNDRQKKFAQVRATKPALHNYEVAREAGYNAAKDATLSQMANALLKKDEIRLEMAKYSNEAELTVFDVMQTSRDRMHSDERRGVDWGTLAQRTAESLLDRVHGKAKQTVDITTKSVNINVDLANQ